MTQEMGIWFIGITTMLVSGLLLNKYMPKKFKRKIEEISKYKWYLVTSIIIICMIIALISLVPFPKIRGISRDAWVTFWGSIIGCTIGGIVGGIVAFKIMQSQINYSNRQKNNDLKLKELPYITLIHRLFEQCIYQFSGNLFDPIEKRFHKENPLLDDSEIYQYFLDLSGEIIKAGGISNFNIKNANFYGLDSITFNNNELLVENKYYDYTMYFMDSDLINSVQQALNGIEKVREAFDKTYIIMNSDKKVIKNSTKEIIYSLYKVKFSNGDEDFINKYIEKYLESSYDERKKKEILSSRLCAYILARMINQELERINKILEELINERKELFKTINNINYK